MNNLAAIKDMCLREMAEFITELIGGIYPNPEDDIRFIEEWLCMPIGAKLVFREVPMFLSIKNVDKLNK